MAAIDEIAAELVRTASFTEMEEEHGGEDGAFADFDKVNKANVTVRLKELQSEGGLSGNAKPQLGINSRKAEQKLGAPNIQALCVALPPMKAEQKAIAAILSDLDEEIAALEAKLAKARQLKQGMMQELLTGRIRLI